MKNRLQCANLLEAILRTEIGFLSDLYANQKRMYECVLIRDWIKLQNETETSEKFVENFLDYERQRIDLLRSEIPGIEGSRDFYRITAQFDEKERNVINPLFREMKRLLLLSKTENEVFNTYITNAKTIVSGMLETVLPTRKNKIYNRRGSLASAPVESLVVNRSF